MLTIATWNVNSVRRRLSLCERFAELTNADVLCLQETKCTEAAFPADVLAELGYEYQAHAGQGGYNGVAIVSRLPLRNVKRHLHCERTDARHISAEIALGSEPLTVHSIYVPAGGELPAPDRRHGQRHAGPAGADGVRDDPSGD